MKLDLKASSCWAVKTFTPLVFLVKLILFIIIWEDLHPKIRWPPSFLSFPCRSLAEYSGGGVGSRGARGRRRGCCGGQTSSCQRREPLLLRHSHRGSDVQPHAGGRAQKTRWVHYGKVFGSQSLTNQVFSPAWKCYSWLIDEISAHHETLKVSTETLKRRRFKQPTWSKSDPPAQIEMK